MSKGKDFSEAYLSLLLGGGGAAWSTCLASVLALSLSLALDQKGNAEGIPLGSACQINMTANAYQTYYPEVEKWT